MRSVANIFLVLRDGVAELEAIEDDLPVPAAVFVLVEVSASFYRHDSSNS